MKEGKSSKDRMPYEKPQVVFKSALEAYAQVCTGNPKSKAPDTPGANCESPYLFS
jgi:hypothetical protein